MENKFQNKFLGSKTGIFVLIALTIIILGAAYSLSKNNTSTVDKNPLPVVIEREILGNKNDLVSFSVLPNSKVQGVVSYRGIIKGGYFFEANIRVAVADKDGKVIKQSNAMATTDWMTAGPVSFEGNIDFSGLPKGEAYIKIENDNPSGLPQNDKSVSVPVIIE